MLIKLPFFIVICLGISSCSLDKIFSSDSSSIKNVHVVDVIKNDGQSAFLVRSSNPVLRGKDFAYEDLKKKIIASGGPKDFYLVDFSLLDVKQGDIDVEKDFFKKNPNLGEVHNYIFLGALENETLASHIFRKRKGEFWDFIKDISNDLKNELLGKENVDELINSVNAEVLKLNIKATDDIVGFLNKDYKKNKPIVVLVHRQAGCDRAGNLIANYRMKEKMMTLKNAFIQSNMECGRAINKESFLSSKNYCNYLKKDGGDKYKNLDCSAEYKK